MTSQPESSAVRASRSVLLTYADTDAAGILYYAAWFPWMERIGVEWLFDNGLRYDTMLAQHGATAVTRATSCDYLSQVTILDRIRIDMSIGHIGQRSYSYAFTMTHELDEVVVARSSMTLVVIDADGKPAAIPPALLDLLTG